MISEDDVHYVVALRVFRGKREDDSVAFIHMLGKAVIQALTDMAKSSIILGEQADEVLKERSISSGGWHKASWVLTLEKFRVLGYLISIKQIPNICYRRKAGERRSPLHHFRLYVVRSACGRNQA